MADVRVICAIGRSGQLGLHGGMPWEGNTARPFVEDVERFFEITRGHVLICGPKTVASFPDFAHDERVVYVGGGPAVWDAYAPFVRHWDINTLPYDGEADTWFDPAWLIAGGKQGRG